MLNFLSYCVLIIFGTVGIFVLCGTVVSLCNTAFRRLGGTPIARFLSILGTPIHELGHLIWCLIFAHRVEGVCLWQPSGRDGVSGYVEHTYNRKNPYQVIGNLFIGVGPMFSGLLAVMLTVRLVFPSVYVGYITSSLGSATLWASLGAGFRALGGIFSSFSGGTRIILEILALMFTVSVCMHMTLSKSDIKSCFKSLPIYLALVLIVAGITYLFRIQGVVYSAMATFFFVALRLFMIIICVELALVALGVLIWFVRKIFLRK